MFKDIISLFYNRKDFAIRVARIHSNNYTYKYVDSFKYPIGCSIIYTSLSQFKDIQEAFCFFIC